MTYIEFFDKISIENIAASLVKPPDRIILIGPYENQMNKHKERYESLFKPRSVNVDIQCMKVDVKNLSAIEEAFSNIVEEDADCVFDLTGGCETLYIGLGKILEKYKDKNIQMHTINITRNKINDYDGDGNTIENNMPHITVNENINIYGGKVVEDNVDSEKATYRWDMNPDFCNDIQIMWEICIEKVGYWNKCVNNIEAIYESSNDKTSLVLQTTDTKYQKYLKENNIKQMNLNLFLNKLKSKGLIINYSLGDDIEIEFKNKQVKRCLIKAGNALEMKTFLTLCSLKDDDGNKLYNDCLNGVVIDWDGITIGNTMPLGTKNEIDVVAIHGLIPVFISCKNGDFSSEELYKLDTVAKHFGGKYAKRVLVSSKINEWRNSTKDSLKDKAEDLIERAKNMGIIILPVLTKDCTFNEIHFAKQFDNLWERNN